MTAELRPWQQYVIDTTATCGPCDCDDCKPAEFEKFPKIPRFNRAVFITEKIDGTNAQVLITEHGTVYAGSRTRFITPGPKTDNFGFAAWVAEHEDALREHLGPGRHFGEWWGPGIQRGYGLVEKRFSLFNTARWGWLDDAQARIASGHPCFVVPTLFAGNTTDLSRVIDMQLDKLRTEGSVAAPGFRNPEGVVVFHKASGTMFKVTVENDGVSKGEAEHLARQERVA